MNIMIIGAGNIGSSLAEELSCERDNVVVIDMNESLCEELNEKLDILTIPGDATSPSVLEIAGIKKTDVVVALTDCDSINVLICGLARHYGVPKRIARLLTNEFSIAGKGIDISSLGITHIVRPDKTVASMGYNGFPRGMSDAEELYADRGSKYVRTIHSEMNAIIHSRERLVGYTLYEWPFLTCDACAKHIIQTGITRVVSPVCPEDKASRWEDSFKTARSLYKEAGIEVVEYLLQDDET